MIASIAQEADIVDVDPDVDRRAWLDWRRGGIGASDIAGVLGISRWASPWSVWADKVGLLPDRTPTTAMKAGTFFEDGIRRWFAEETGWRVHGAQVALQSKNHDIVRCTADGALLNADWVLIGGLEIKYEGPSRAWEEVPPMYQAQGQWQMLTAGWDVVHFAVVHGRYPDFEHRLDRDEADIKLMLERGEQFWAEHVVTGVPPDVDGSDATANALKAVYPNGIAGEQVDVGEIADVVAAWREAKADAKAAEARAKAAANQITAALGDATEGAIDGQLVVSWRQQTRKETVQAASTFRVLRTHEKKEMAHAAE